MVHRHCVYLAPLRRYGASNIGRTDVDTERKMEKRKEKVKGKKEEKREEEKEWKVKEEEEKWKREGKGKRKGNREYCSNITELDAVTSYISSLSWAF